MVSSSILETEGHTENSAPITDNMIMAKTETTILHIHVSWTFPERLREEYLDVPMPRIES